MGHVQSRGDPAAGAEAALCSSLAGSSSCGGPPACHCVGARAACSRGSRRLAPAGHSRGRAGLRGSGRRRPAAGLGGGPCGPSPRLLLPDAEQRHFCGGRRGGGGPRRGILKSILPLILPACCSLSCVNPSPAAAVREHAGSVARRHAQRRRLGAHLHGFQAAERVRSCGSPAARHFATDAALPILAWQQRLHLFGAKGLLPHRVLGRVQACPARPQPEGGSACGCNLTIPRQSILRPPIRATLQAIERAPEGLSAELTKRSCAAHEGFHWLLLHSKEAAWPCVGGARGTAADTHPSRHVTRPVYWPTISLRFKPVPLLQHTQP